MMATNYCGYTGKIMLVDLTRETVREYLWNDTQRQLYLGGKIMANKILLDHLTGEESAFCEDNWVVITTGPLTLSGAPSSTRYDISSISPMTGVPASSNCGGDFGLHMKRAGYDALILAGRCGSHRWLEINDDAFTFHDADFLWGTRSGPCKEQLDRQMGNRKYGTLYIGPAGENLVRYASVMDGTHTSGRTGIGAVFGWKNLKAITITGSKTLPIFEPEETAQWKKKWFLELHSHPLTGKNSRAGTPTSKACPGCPILCRRQFNKGDDAQTEYLNQLGMDSVSALDAVAWAEAAAAEGILNEQITDNSAIFEDIAHRRGIGDDLAEGVKHLSKKYRFKLPKQKKSAVEKHNRNDGFPAILKGWGLDLDQLPIAEKLDYTMLYMDLCEAVSASGLCMFSVNAFCPASLLNNPESLRSKWIHRCMPRMGWAIHLLSRHPRLLCMPLPLFYNTKMLRHVCGMSMTPGAFIEVGARGFALEQLLCEKFGADTTKLPKMLSKEPDETVAARYFENRGWSAQGIPTPAAIQKLKI